MKKIQSFGMRKTSIFLIGLLKEADAGKQDNSSCLSWSNVMAFISPLTFWNMEPLEKSLMEIPVLVAEIK